MATIILAFCAGILTLMLVVLVRGRILEARWWQERKAAAEAAAEHANAKFLNRGERLRRQKKQGRR